MGKTSLVSATLLQTKLALYTYATCWLDACRQADPDGLYWDTADPYHYLRVEPEPGSRLRDLRRRGSQDRPGRRTHAQCYAALETNAPAYRCRRFELTDRWSGQVIETTDGLPYIGETAARQFVATGFAGNGMTFGTLAAMMARDAALGRTNPWREIFDPDRTRLRAAAWDYLQGEQGLSLLHRARPLWRDTPGAAGPWRRGQGKILRHRRAERGGLSRRQGQCASSARRSARTWDAR